MFRNVSNLYFSIYQKSIIIILYLLYILYISYILYIYIYTYTCRSLVEIPCGWSYGQRVLFRIGPGDPSSPETSRRRKKTKQCSNHSKLGLRYTFVDTVASFKILVSNSKYNFVGERAWNRIGGRSQGQAAGS